MKQDDVEKEWISAEFPKGTKVKIRLFAAQCGYKGMSEVIRVAVDRLMKAESKGEKK